MPASRSRVIDRTTEGDRKMGLDWKSYGDTGLTAKGDKGSWRITTDGRWWHIALQPPLAQSGSQRGKCVSRQRAVQLAQELDGAAELSTLAPMNGCGCWCYECTNQNAGWHCRSRLCAQ